MRQIGKNVNSERSGVIDCAKFLAATSSKWVCDQGGVWRTAFRTFGLDTKGTITQGEIRAALCGDELSNVMGVRAIADMIKKARYDLGDDHGFPEAPEASW